jgi:hypothetical protein
MSFTFTTVPVLVPVSTRQAITKMGQTVLPHPAHILDLAPSNYHLFDPVKNPLHGCHLADANEVKVFVMCCEVETGNFTTKVYSILINAGKSVLKMTDLVGKTAS